MTDLKLTIDWVLLTLPESISNINSIISLRIIEGLPYKLLKLSLVQNDITYIENLDDNFNIIIKFNVDDIKEIAPKFYGRYN